MKEGPGSKFDDIRRQTSVPPASEKRWQDRRVGWLRWKADRNNSPPNPSVPPQARPSSDPFQRQNLPPAKTAPNSWLLALPPRWLNCRRWQRRQNSNQPPRLKFFFGHLGRFSAVSGNHRPSLLELLDDSFKHCSHCNLQVNHWQPES